MNTALRWRSIAFHCCILPILTALLTAQAAGQSASEAALQKKSGSTAAPSFELVGFAKLAAYGLNGTTGGGTARAVTVRTAAEFQAAVERSDIRNKKLRDETPRVVRVVEDIDLGELANETPGVQLTSVGIVKVRPHTTIFSTGSGASIRRGIIEIHGAHNIIIRNLKFRDLWEEDPSGEYDRLGWDYIRVTNSGKTKSHHIWIDHCDFEKAYDGLIDITHGSDLITVSWCRLAGNERGPQKKCMLIGHSSSANAAALDRGRLNVTLHHNWFENISDRAPRTRFGNVHLFNSFIDGAENATISVAGAVTLVENCFYQDARIATTFSHADDNVAAGRGGTLVIVDSCNIEPRPIPENPARDPFAINHHFRSSVERSALLFNPAADWAWKNRGTLPYAYHLDPVTEVPALVRQFAGTGRISDSSLTGTSR
ncbi:MAG: hypothetical protein M3463_21490 [Verrucomicrobiota bacterium]|nr:hypothetical protein [Verrucomicrobiota bacterium]